MHHKTLNKRNEEEEEEEKTTKISYFYNSENELSSRSPALVLNRVLKCIFL